MSAAAARRRKQLAARKAAEGTDTVTQQLNKLLLEEETLDEATAYEALQLAQSQVRKKVHGQDFKGACDLAYQASLSLLKKKRVSVASQLLTVLAEVLRETHTEETDAWIARIDELNTAHANDMKDQPPGQENVRLLRLQRDWIRSCMGWSSDLGTIKFGNNKIHELYAKQCWKLSEVEVDDPEEQMEMRCEGIQHMMLAEQPASVIAWLKTLPAPTEEETKLGHTCPPALRDALFTRALLLACAMENLRDATTLVQLYMGVDERKIEDLKASYTKKDDGISPSHIIFGSMLVRICEKDTRTGPLYSWLLRSFKRELDRMYKPGVIHGFTTKIGKIYFNIQPPPSMLNMVENMMGMMGGGGGMGGGMNPAMLQQAMMQMQQGGMM
eukprot:scaffold11639_cov172-Amphora_coffeaeformis.AAC.34